MKRFKINQDISLAGFQLTDRGRWLGLESIEAEGNTLDQLLDDITVFTVDQEGEEGPQLSLDDLSDDQVYYIENLLKSLIKS